VYRIILEATNIFQCVPDIMSHLYLCIWHYYKDEIVILWEKKNSCTHKHHPATAMSIWSIFLISLPFHPPLTASCFYPCLPFSFLGSFWLICKWLTPSVSIYHSYERKVCPRLCVFRNANNHCPLIPHLCSSLCVSIFTSS
jgi:hypothetical protein